MRNSLADALFSQTRGAILAATLLRGERWWYLSDLARHIGVRPSSLQRELAGLVQAGILLRREEGRQVYFKPNPQCPILDELQAIMAKTWGMADVLSEALRPFADSIACAFVYGSLGRGQARSESDVDLMIVGRAKLADLAPALKESERRLGRPVNPCVYTAAEFAKKLSNGQHFLTSVHRGPKVFVVGSEHDLATASKPGTGSPAPDEPAGTRRPARRRRARLG